MRAGIAALLLIIANAGPGAADTIRIATFNTSLNREAPSAMARELEIAPSAQARAVVEIVRRVRPDVLVVNELDDDPDGRALEAFAALLRADDGEGAPLDYAHRFRAPVNTGVQSGLDLDGDGTIGGPGDAWGFGTFAGQYGMAVLSHLPLDVANVRTFQTFRWADLPDNLLPRAFYGEAADALRLSSKSHWDLPVLLGDGGSLHLLVSHPTPPVFDGPEDRNGRRNADEVGFWRHYVDGAGDWLVDDAGTAGGLRPDRPFVILGDLNLSTTDGDGRGEAMVALLAHPRVEDARPRSAGAVEAAARDGGANASHAGDPALDTADWRDSPGPGNLRVDYALPSAELRVAGAGVFWPAEADDPEGAALARRASDHRLVWVDLELP